MGGSYCFGTTPDLEQEFILWETDSENFKEIKIFKHFGTNIETATELFLESSCQAYETIVFLQTNKRIK